MTGNFYLFFNFFKGLRLVCICIQIHMLQTFASLTGLPYGDCACINHPFSDRIHCLEDRIYLDYRGFLGQRDKYSHFHSDINPLWPKLACFAEFPDSVFTRGLASVHPRVWGLDWLVTGS